MTQFVDDETLAEFHSQPIPRPRLVNEWVPRALQPLNGVVAAALHSARRVLAVQVLPDSPAAKERQGLPTCIMPG